MSWKRSYLFTGICIAVAAVALIFAVMHASRTPSDKASVSQMPLSHSPSKPAPVIQLNISEKDLQLTKSTKTLDVAIKSDTFATIVKVEYLVDGKVTAQSSTAPFTSSIPLTGLGSGNHTLQAYAYDAAGNFGKSETFSFTIAADDSVTPADQTSRAVIRQSMPAPSLAKAVSAQRLSNSSTMVDNNQPSGNGNSNGNTSPAPPASPWPTTPPAQICGNNSILGNGPTVAPAGAVVVPAGDNSSLVFAVRQPNTVFWYAPGVHTLGNGQYDQIQPGDNSTFIGAPEAIIDGQGLNNFAFTGTATGVTIKYLTIKNFVAPLDQGVVNHDSGSNWTMQYNTATLNQGAGMFIGASNQADYNCLSDNGQYGFQVYGTSGISGIVLDHNEISGNNTGDWEHVANGGGGCGCTGGGKFWDARNVRVTNNYVHDNKSAGLWADTNNADFLFENNYISGNDGQGIFYEISYNMVVRNNNFIRNALVNGPTNPGFPTGAIYISESGGDNRVTSQVTNSANIDIYDNNFTDNWAGVVLWENADRFCSSPANTSSGYCTLVNPAATLVSCGDPSAGGSVNTEPYKSDCRWKTQNVKVHNNVFAIDKSAIPSCATTDSCGLQGIFSNSGSSPSWSPYMGDVVEQDITFNQNNLFSSNTYTGDWNFMPKDQSKILNFAIWQGAPYSQDSGSTINGQTRLVIANALDANTATIEGSVGDWIAWFLASVSQSSAEAHGGTKSLQVDANSQFWGIELGHPTGFALTPGHKTVSYWSKLGAGVPGAQVSLAIHWLDESQNVLRTDTLAAPDLTGTWQKATLDVHPPTGAVTVNLQLSSSTSTTGDTIYLDDFSVADTP